MAKIYPFTLVDPDDIILTDVLLKRHTASLVFDTGATHTIIDLNTILIAGYNFSAEGTKQFETANGIIEADLFRVDSLRVWDTLFNNVHVFVLDFLAAGIISQFEGVLGLDIMRNFKIEIDFEKSNLVVE